ncbi:hypothetical protein ABG79_01867 [Caloramator mitchellensis]|uniref:Uncharacterized protein n=1 Tax=Caloramator mitchellensis TaxID=908809 RepID=A0A0R3JS59_CALMK|nr:hypothetical protein ABG79_01867 [Caloramator mitchellensis]
MMRMSREQNTSIMSAMKDMDAVEDCLYSGAENYMNND